MDFVCVLNHNVNVLNRKMFLLLSVRSFLAFVKKSTELGVPQTYVRKCKQTGLLVSLVTSDVFSSPNLFCVLTDCTIPLRVAMPPTLPFYCSEIYFLFPKSSSCNLTSCGPGGGSCRFRKPQTPLFLSRVQGILSASDLFLLRVQLFKVI